MVSNNYKFVKDRICPRRIGQAARNEVLTSTAKLTGLREYCSTGKFSWIETSKLRLNSTPTLKMRTGIEKG